MSARTYSWPGSALALVLIAGATQAAPVPPYAPAEAWVFVQTEKGKWAIRVDGGPPKQVDVEAPPRPNVPKVVRLANVGAHAWEVEGGKRVVYAEDIPETQGRGKQLRDWRRRLVIADPKGQNPKTLLTGLGRNGECAFTPDGKAVVCGAERDGKWDVYRVPFDGTEPIKLSRTHGTEGINFRLLKDERVAYFAITGEHVEPFVIKGMVAGTTSSPVGAVVLSDGKAERVLIKQTHAGLPEFTADGSKMAVTDTTDKGEAVVVVTELKTGKSERFLLSAFKNDWKCQFGEMRFSPDGKALVVGFSLGSVVFREDGPIAGDEAVEHFGVIWLDGRRQQTALFRIDQPRRGGGYFADLRRFEWTRRPAGKD